MIPVLVWENTCRSSFLPGIKKGREGLLPVCKVGFGIWGTVMYYSKLFVRRVE